MQYNTGESSKKKSSWIGLQKEKVYDVLLVSFSFYPDIEATSKLMFDLAEDLAEKGLKVAVFTQNRSYIDPQQQFSSFESVKGCDVYRTKTPCLNKNKAFSKLLMYWIFARSAARFTKQIKVGTVLAVFPPFFTAFNVLKICKRKNIPFVLILHDLHPDTAIRRKQISKNHPLALLLKKQTRFLMKSSSRIVTLGRDVTQYLIEAYKVLPEKISYIPNWGREISDISPNFNRHACMRDSFLVLYTGNFGEASDFATLFQAAKQLEKVDEDIRFLLVGNGRKKSFWEDYVKRNSISNVTFSDFVPEEKYTDLLKQAFVLVLTLRESSKGMSVPSKLYYYLSVGKPILAIVPELSEVDIAILQDNFGLSCRNNDVKSVIRSLLKFKNDQEHYHLICKNAVQTFNKKYSQKICTNQYYELIKSILRANNLGNNRF